MTDTGPGDILEVKIERIVPRGLGLGFAGGLTVFVPLSAVGDDLRVRVREVKRRVAFAEIVDVIVPGDARIPAPCPHFGVCGGCNFQHLTYEAQLAAKVAIIRDCLDRIGKIAYEREIPIVASPLEFEYRSRVRWHVDPASQAFGYMRRDSNALVDIRVCPILTPPLQRTLTELRSKIDKQAGGEIEAASGGDTVSIYSRELSGDAAEVTVDLAGESYTFTAAAFFQANQSLIQDLVELALGDAAAVNV
jgi:23S rRNA (uracil1939-C5)-methyltransferase